MRHTLKTLSVLVAALAWSLPAVVAADEAQATEEEGEGEAEDEASGRRDRVVEELTYEQHPGLPPAASKIFFSDRRYAISGFGELSYTHYLGDKNTSTGDLELFNTNLYRFVVYGAYRATDWMVVYAEAFAELYHDGFSAVDHEIFIEAFLDFVITRPFNVRVGWFQIPIGYVNNNDEPIMFYSVNRPEVERLIIPTQWIELGVQLYGHIGQCGSWLVSAFQGVEGGDLVGASWIRQGRHLRFNFRSFGLAGQLNYKPIDGLELSVSGLVMQSGNGERVERDGEEVRVRAPTGILSAYARYEWKNFSVMALGTVGFMGDTEGIYDVTSQRDQGAQVLGARTYGYYVELGWDVLHYAKRSRPHKHTALIRTDEFKLPVFVRYERLDTHGRIDPSLRARLGSGDAIHRSNLDVVTIGANFNLRRNLVLKTNYQFRSNRYRGADVAEGDRFEFGLGFIF